MKKQIGCLLLVLAGCQTTKKPCSDETKMTEVLTHVIVQTFACKNPEEVTTSVRAQLELAGVCQEHEAGALGPVFCRPLASYFRGMIMNRFPTKWGCSGGIGAAVLESTVYKGCVGVSP